MERGGREGGREGGSMCQSVLLLFSHSLPSPTHPIPYHVVKVIPYTILRYLLLYLTVVSESHEWLLGNRIGEDPGVDYKDFWKQPHPLSRIPHLCELHFSSAHLYLFSLFTCRVRHNERLEFLGDAVIEFFTRYNLLNLLNHVIMPRWAEPRGIQ